MRLKIFATVLCVIILFGCGKESTSITKLAPENLEIELIGGSEIHLNWDDVSSNETGFILQRKLQNEEFETIVELDDDTSIYLDETVVAGNTYYYRVAGVYGNEFSDWSNEVNISIAYEITAPENLIGNLINSETIQLTWDDVCLQETGFILERKLGYGSYSALAELEGNTSSYLDETVVGYNSYKYRLKAIFGDEFSAWSNEINVYTQAYLDELEFGTSNSLDVITWNIEEFPKQDEDTVLLVAQALFYMSPEVVGLQEIESSTSFNAVLDSLNSWDTENTWSGFRSTEAYYQVNLAVIYKENVFSDLSITEIYTHDSSPFPRPPLVFDAVYDGERIVIINNHLKAGSEENDLARRLEASVKLKLYIDDNLATENVIVIGDMNDEISDTEEENVFQNFIDDSTNYHYADWEIAFGASTDWSYPNWPSHIDHILITNELMDNYDVDEVSTIKLAPYFLGGWGDYDHHVSDHLPVGIRFRF